LDEIDKDAGAGHDGGMSWETLAARAAEMDAADGLARFRARFRAPGDSIYLDGNSLGLLPHATAARMRAVVEEEWGEKLITSWNGADWIGMPRRIGGLLEPLLGAEAGAVVACDSVSVNLFKLAAGALRLNPGRRVILSEAGNFPTDLYVLEGVADALGAELRVLPRGELLTGLGPEVALLVLTHAHYRGCALWDMAAVGAAARAAGVLLLWDLSHSAGAVALDLSGAAADFAVGCGYKYLNGGPGAPAWAYVAPRHQAALRQPLQGWMGHAAPFAFEDGYRPAAGVQRLVGGTPPVLAMAALEEGVKLAAEAGQAAAAAKARALGDLFIACLDLIGDPELVLESPRAGDVATVERAGRGGHVLFRHPEAYAIVQALIARGVVGDYREPMGARFGFSPLTLSHGQVVEAGRVLGEVLRTRAFDRDAYRVRGAVT
jgi:kynureninase